MNDIKRGQSHCLSYLAHFRERRNTEPFPRTPPPSHFLNDDHLDKTLTVIHSLDKGKINLSNRQCIA